MKRRQIAKITLMASIFASSALTVALAETAAAPSSAPAPNTDPSPNQPTIPNTKPAPAAAEIQPTIQFTSPAANSHIKDYPVVVDTQVTNFVLEPPVQFWDRVLPQDRLRGHIHYTLDDSPIFASRVTHFIIAKPMGKALPPGKHILRAELVNANHVPLSPPIVAEIPFFCDGDKTTAPQTEAVIPINAQGRAQLGQLEIDLKRTQEQIDYLKSHVKDQN